jgi:hypothetical protein
MGWSLILKGTEEVQVSRFLLPNPAAGVAGKIPPNFNSVTAFHHYVGRVKKISRELPNHSVPVGG